MLILLEHWTSLIVRIPRSKSFTVSWTHTFALYVLEAWVQQWSMHQLFLKMKRINYGIEVCCLWLLLWACCEQFFISMGTFFCLHGVHRSLKISQLQRFINMCIQRMIQKTGVGGLRDLKVENKVVPIIANPAASERRHVYLINLYLSKLPQKVNQVDCLDQW